MRRFTPGENLSLISQFLVRYRSICRFNHLTQPVVREYQFKRIQHLVSIAYNHTELYRRKYDLAGVHPRDIRSWSDFSRVPTLTKAELTDAGLDAVNTRTTFDKLIPSSSSGSTGKFVTVYLDPQVLITQALQACRMLQEMTPSYAPFDKELLVYTSRYPYSSIGGLYRSVYVNNLLAAERIREVMLHVKPAIVAIYPSILREILQLGDLQLHLPNLKTVVTNSEHSTQEERNLFARQLDCSVYDEFSSEELSSIAYQCRYNNYHMTQDSSYLELISPGSHDTTRPGEIGEMVGTCLINEAMPIIRYHQDDLAIMGEAKCPCGRSAPILEALEGRRNACFRRGDGTLIPSGRILDWTYSLILTHQLAIREFRITQETPESIEIELVVMNYFDEVVDGGFLATKFREAFGESFLVTPRIVSSIERSASGKYNPIRSLIQSSCRN